MSVDRRQFLGHTGKLLWLTGAAALGFDHLLAGQPAAAPNYDMTEHWWGMLIDIGEVHRLRQLRAGLHGGEPRPGGLLLPHVGGALPVPREAEHPEVDSPKGARRVPAAVPAGTWQELLRPKLCNHCAHSPCVQVCPVGATFESPDGVVLVDKNYCLGCRYCVQACPTAAATSTPDGDGRQVHLCYHRITKGLTTACCETCPTGARQLARPQRPERSRSTSSCGRTRCRS